MTDVREWRGVRLTLFEARFDPDAGPVGVAVPVGWGEVAAAGFAGLAAPAAGASDLGVLRLPVAAARWIAPIARAASGGGGSDRLGGELHALLLQRRVCPDAGIWRGEPIGPHEGFVIDLAAFAETGDGADVAGLEDAAATVALALSLYQPKRAGVLGAIRLAGFELALARLGLAYASGEGRDVAAALVRTVRDAIGRVDPRIGLRADHGGPAEMLLEIEATGIAPAFDVVTADGRLTRAAAATLVRRDIPLERALAMALVGCPPIAPADEAAHRAMHEVLAPLLDAVPSPRRAPTPRSAPPESVHVAASRRLPARTRGFTQKASIGGHRLYLRTGQFEDGALGEIAIAMPGRGDGLQKSLLEGLARAVSIGLQHDVPLAAYVDAFAGHGGAPRGAVEGDPSIRIASGPLDYVFRALAEAYLGRHLADPPPREADEPDDLPLLPLERPARQSTRPRQSALRLVHAS